MIMFKQDWQNYPQAIVHTSTRNKSWVRHAELLKTMGVENYFCHLALIDPSLEHVDPHDENLDSFTKKKIINECFENPWYWLRECVRVPAKASSTPKMLDANRGNIALYFTALNNIDVGLVQIRQTGKSLNCNILTTYMLTLKMQNTTVFIMTHTGKLRNDQVDAIREVRKNLPPYLAMVSKDDVDNTESISVSINNNKITTALPQSSPEDATRAGRGFTTPIIHIDEPAFCKNIEYSFPAIMAASDAASEEALANGYPSYRLFSTTAGNLDSASGKFMYKVFHSVCRWREQLMDANSREELQETIRTNSKNRRLMCYIEYNHRQLGKSDAWLYDRIIRSEASADEVNRDYFNVWTTGSGGSPLDRLIRDAISNSKKAPLWVEKSSDGYVLNWHISKEQLADRIRRDVKLVAGLDSSEGLGNDRMTLVVLDEETLEVVATLTISDVVSIIKFADYVSDLMVKYPTLILIPERKSTGIAIIDTLLMRLPSKDIDPFGRIFNRCVHDQVNMNQDLLNTLKTPLSRRPISVYEKYKSYFGFVTAGRGEYSRNSLYELILPRLANYSADLVRDESLISEIMGLVNKNGRIDHSASGHDDMVISWLLAGWLLMFGKNLSDYGITNALMRVTPYKDKTDNAEVTKVKEFRSKEQEQFRVILSDLVRRLTQAQGELEAALIEKKIRHYTSKISIENKLPMSIDEVIRQANEARKQRFRS